MFKYSMVGIACKMVQKRIYFQKMFNANNNEVAGSSTNAANRLQSIPRASVTALKFTAGIPIFKHVKWVEGDVPVFKEGCILAKEPEIETVPATAKGHLQCLSPSFLTSEFARLLYAPS